MILAQTSRHLRPIHPIENMKAPNLKQKQEQLRNQHYCVFAHDSMTNM